jgi:uncharacterized membrane protein
LLTKLVSRSLVAVVLLSALISFLKFNHCRSNEFISPDNYIHACYTDIAALYSERALDLNTFPYLSEVNSMEYPPVTGLFAWAISFITPNSSHVTFFDLNVLFLILMFFISALILKQLAPKYLYLFLASPAVIASLFINWDLIAVASALLTVYFFEKKKYEESAIALGVSIATKFFPIVLLLPIAIIFYRRKQIKQLSRYLYTTAILWLAINLPIAILYFDGWWRFFKLNIERGADFGSIWYGLSLLNINISNLDLIYPLLSIALFTALAFYLLKLDKIPNLALVAFFALVIFTTFGKVYSPQYVLWLTPFAVIAITNSKQQISFWFWQITEIIYHLAIWQYLALYAGAKYGLPDGGYVIATLLRVVGVSTFTFILMRDLAAKSTVKSSVISR